MSEDVSSGSVNRILKGVSTANFTVLNQGSKYDGMFSPMDTVAIYLRRIRTMLKFTGYLDAVPLWQFLPGSINLSASCSLKRLQYFYWDPHAPASVQLLDSSQPYSGGAGDPQNHSMMDGGIGDRTVTLLNQVAGWPKGQIHIARIPTDWADQIAGLADKLVAEAEAARIAQDAGSIATIQGTSGGTGAGTTGGSMLSSVAGIGKGTGQLPSTSGKISSFGGPGGGAYGNMALTGESGTHPRDGWYCAMRWPYTEPGAVAGAKQWWTNRHIQVVNPKNNKSVVLRAADWGPAAWTGRVIDVAPNALKALGAATDDTVHIGFAPEGSSVGVVDKNSAGLGATLANQNVATGSGASGQSSGWGSPGDRSNIVAARAGGLTFYVNRIAKDNFEGFVNELIKDYGYHPKSIGGFSARKIAGSSTWSNHAYGAAIDIDPTRNPRYGSSAGGPYALPKPPGIVNLARKWGLYWGGEYNHSKDYMHFEVIGAPATPSVKGYKGETGVTYIKKWTPPIHGNYTVTNRFGDAGPYAHRHTGTDFACSTGTNIYPVGPGTVHNKGTGDASYGNWVSLDMGGGYYTFYAHMEGPATVNVGDSVTTNTVIGHVDSTGNVTGPHVHLELRHPTDSYGDAISIEKYVLGGANRADPPKGVLLAQGEATGAGAAAGSGTPQLTPEQEGQGLFNAFQFDRSLADDQSANLLSGYRAILNDQPILDTITELMSTGMRDFCSAPNGDFIAWFPDYFGHYQQAGKMVIDPIEVQIENGPPAIGWADTNLKTHMFVSSSSGYGSGDAQMPWRTATTAGIASVEFPEIMQALFKISKKEAQDMGKNYLMRYGARPDYVPMNSMTGARNEFYMACHLFMVNWTQQYQASINLTFMPELYPGMLLCLPEFGMQGYIQATTDSWDLAGGGFTTTVMAAPWSTIGKSTPVGGAILPKGAPL